MWTGPNQMEEVLRSDRTLWTEESDLDSGVFEGIHVVDKGYEVRV